MFFAEITPTQIVLLITVVAVTSFLLMKTSRYFTRTKSAEPSWSSIARGSKDSPIPGRDIPIEMNNWQVEMHEFVRGIKAELDSKMRALQVVTAEADRAAARLEAAMARTTNFPDSREDEVAVNLPPEGEKSPLLFRKELPKGKQGIDLSKLPSSQVDSLSPAGVPHAEHSSAQSKKEEIYMLADYGMESAEIASRVGHPIGEVELILSLRGKK